MNTDIIMAVCWIGFGIYQIVRGIQLIGRKGSYAERLAKAVKKEEAYISYCRKIGTCQIVIGVAFVVCEGILLFMRSKITSLVFLVLIVGALVYQAVCSKKYTGTFFGGL